jgi:hypothetical protein
MQEAGGKCAGELGTCKLPVDIRRHLPGPGAKSTARLGRAARPGSGLPDTLSECAYYWFGKPKQLLYQMHLSSWRFFFGKPCRPAILDPRRSAHSSISEQVLLFATSEPGIPLAGWILVYAIQRDSKKTSDGGSQAPRAGDDFGRKVKNLWRFDTLQHAIWYPGPSKLAQSVVQLFYLQRSI